MSSTDFHFNWPPTRPSIDFVPVHLFYRLEGGGIRHLWYDGDWHRDRWDTQVSAPPAVGNPAVMAAHGAQHLFYRDARSLIQHIWWDGTFHGPEDWISTVGAPLAVGDPAVVAAHGRQHLLYRNADSGIQHIWWDGAPHRGDDWVGWIGAPLAAGDPAVAASTDAYHLFYRTDADVIEHIALKFDSSQIFLDHFELDGAAPKLKSDPAATFIPPDSGFELIGGVQLYYLGVDGLIQHVSNYGEGSYRVQVTTSAPAAGKPVVTTDGRLRHLFHRDLDGGLWYIGDLSAFNNASTRVFSPIELDLQEQIKGDPAAMCAGPGASMDIPG